MSSDTNWNKLASNVLKSELKLKGLSYEQLHEKLSGIGVNESLGALKVKINRGTFQFAFFIQCAMAIGLKNLRLDRLDMLDEN